MAGSVPSGYRFGMRRGLVGVAGALALALVATVAVGRPAGAGKGAVAARKRHAAPPRRTGKISHPPKLVAAKRPATSVGSPTDGRLVGGVELEPGPAVRLKRPGGPHWGLPRLVALLERGARKVESRFDGSVLLVGDLSRARGGDLGGHHSHESGRDADVGFYFVDRAGHPAEPHRFHHVRWDGRATDEPSLRFDDARNWELVKAWVTDPGARVQHVFIAKPLRTRLLSFARQHGTYLPVLQRAAIAMKQPGHAPPHDDHFHIRIACPGGQRDVCVSEPHKSEQPARQAKEAHARHAQRHAEAEPRQKRQRGGS